MNLLEQGLRVSQTTRRIWLRNLSTAQREQLQTEMTARAAELGIVPAKTAMAPAPLKMDKDRYNAVRSGSFVNGKRAVRIGRHLILIPAGAKYKRTRDTLCYVYFRGVVTGYAARGAKLVKLHMDADTRAHIARSLFNVKT